MAASASASTSSITEDKTSTPLQALKWITRGIEPFVISATPAVPGPFVESPFFVEPVPAAVQVEKVVRRLDLVTFDGPLRALVLLDVPVAPAKVKGAALSKAHKQLKTNEGNKAASAPDAADTIEAAPTTAAAAASEVTDKNGRLPDGGAAIQGGGGNNHVGDTHILVWKHADLSNVSRVHGILVNDARVRVWTNVSKQQGASEVAYGRMVVQGEDRFLFRLKADQLDGEVAVWLPIHVRPVKIELLVQETPQTGVEQAATFVTA